jgi:hypothetical protein
MNNGQIFATYSLSKKLILRKNEDQGEVAGDHGEIPLRISIKQ